MHHANMASPFDAELDLEGNPSTCLSVLIDLCRSISLRSRHLMYTPASRPINTMSSGLRLLTNIAPGQQEDRYARVCGCSNYGS